MVSMMRAIKPLHLTNLPLTGTNLYCHHIICLAREVHGCEQLTRAVTGHLPHWELNQGLLNPLSNDPTAVMPPSHPPVCRLNCNMLTNLKATSAVISEVKRNQIFTLLQQQYTTSSISWRLNNPCSRPGHQLSHN